MDGIACASVSKRFQAPFLANDYVAPCSHEVVPSAIITPNACFDIGILLLLTWSDGARHVGDVLEGVITGGSISGVPISLRNGAKIPLPRRACRGN
jgi:hypothetical protein